MSLDTVEPAPEFPTVSNSYSKQARLAFSISAVCEACDALLELFEIYDEHFENSPHSASARAAAALRRALRAAGPGEVCEERDDSSASGVASVSGAWSRMQAQDAASDVSRLYSIESVAVGVAVAITWATMKGNAAPSAAELAEAALPLGQAALVMLLTGPLGMEAQLAEQCAAMAAEGGPRLVRELGAGQTGWLAGLVQLVQPAMMPLLSEKLVQSALRKLVRGCFDGEEDTGGGSSMVDAVRTFADAVASSCTFAKLKSDVVGHICLAVEGGGKAVDMGLIRETLSPERLRICVEEAVVGFVWPWLRSEVRRAVMVWLQKQVPECDEGGAERVLLVLEEKGGSSLVDLRGDVEAALQSAVEGGEGLGGFVGAVEAAERHLQELPSELLRAAEASGVVSQADISGLEDGLQGVLGQLELLSERIKVVQQRIGSMQSTVVLVSSTIIRLMSATGSTPVGLVKTLMPALSALSGLLIMQISDALSVQLSLDDDSIFYCALSVAEAGTQLLNDVDGPVPSWSQILAKLHLHIAEVAGGGRDKLVDTHRSPVFLGLEQWMLNLQHELKRYLADECNVPMRVSEALVNLGISTRLIAPFKQHKGPQVIIELLKLVFSTVIDALFNDPSDSDQKGSTDSTIALLMKFSCRLFQYTVLTDKLNLSAEDAQMLIDELESCREHGPHIPFVLTKGDPYSHPRDFAMEMGQMPLRLVYLCLSENKDVAKLANKIVFQNPESLKALQNPGCCSCFSLRKPILGALKIYRCLSSFFTYSFLKTEKMFYPQQFAEDPTVVKLPLQVLDTILSAEYDDASLQLCTELDRTHIFITHNLIDDMPSKNPSRHAEARDYAFILTVQAALSHSVTMAERTRRLQLKVRPGRQNSIYEGIYTRSDRHVHFRPMYMHEDHTSVIGWHFAGECWVLLDISSEVYESNSYFADTIGAEHHNAVYTTLFQRLTSEFAPTSNSSINGNVSVDNAVWKDWESCSLDVTDHGKSLQGYRAELRLLQSAQFRRFVERSASPAVYLRYDLPQAEASQSSVVALKVLAGFYVPIDLNVSSFVESSTKYVVQLVEQATHDNQDQFEQSYFQLELDGLQGPEDQNSCVYYSEVTKSFIVWLPLENKHTWMLYFPIGTGNTRVQKRPGVYYSESTESYLFYRAANVDTGNLLLATWSFGPTVDTVPDKKVFLVPTQGQALGLTAQYNVNAGISTAKHINCIFQHFPRPTSGTHRISMHALLLKQCKIVLCTYANGCTTNLPALSFQRASGTCFACRREKRLNCSRRWNT
jgi:hypothetical protein